MISCTLNSEATSIPFVTISKLVRHFRGSASKAREKEFLVVNIPWDKVVSTCHDRLNIVGIWSILDIPKSVVLIAVSISLSCINVWSIPLTTVNGTTRSCMPHQMTKTITILPSVVLQIQHLIGVISIV